MPGYIETDRKEALKEVRRAHPAYYSIAPEFWEDRKFVEAALKAHGDAYKYAAPQFRMDPEFIDMAIAKMQDYKCGLSFKDFPDEIKNDVNWVRKAMQADTYAFAFASDAVKDNKDFAFEALKEYSSNYGELSDRLKNDKDIVMAAVSCASYLYERYIPEALKDDADVILAATRSRRINENMMKALPEFVFTDKDLIIQMVENKTTQLVDKVPRELFADKNFVEKLLSVSTDYWESSKLMSRVSSELRADKDFALFAVNQFAGAYSSLSYELKVDRDVARATLEKDITYIEYMDYVLEPEIDKDYALAIAEQGYKLFSSSAMSNYIGDEDVALAAVLKDPYSYRTISADLQKNEGIALALMTHPPYGMSSIPQGCFELSHAHPELLNNKEFMLEAVKFNSKALNVPGTDRDTAPLFKDREFLLSVQPYISDNDCCKAFENDKEFILEAVKVRPEAIKLATNNLRFDREFIDQAIKNNVEVKKFCEASMVRPDISYFKAKMEPKKEEIKKEPQTLADVISAAKKSVQAHSVEKNEKTDRESKDER